MKQNYVTPQVEVDLIMMEGNFLASQRVASAPDLEYDSEVDPW